MSCESAILAVRKHLHGKHVLPLLAHAAHDQHLVIEMRVQVFDELRLTHEVCDVLAQIALRVETEMEFGNCVAPLDLIVIVEHRDAVWRRLNGLDKTRMLLLDLTHLRMPALGELVQPVIDFAPDARCARHLAIYGRVEQTPQTLLVERAEACLRAKHDNREDQCRVHVHEHANACTCDREQHQRHDGARPDDVHVLPIEERFRRAAKEPSQRCT
jgi:hypothetical protein